MSTTDELARALRGEEPRPMYHRSFLLPRRRTPDWVAPTVMLALAVVALVLIVRGGWIG